MYCSKCQNQNEENARFCGNCGAYLDCPQVKNQSNDVSNALLITFIIIAFVCRITQFAAHEIASHNKYDLPVKFVMNSLWILQSINFILPALAIKNKALKIVGIIFACLITIYAVSSMY